MSCPYPTQTNNFIVSPTDAPVQTANHHPLYTTSMSHNYIVHTDVRKHKAEEIYNDSVYYVLLHYVCGRDVNGHN